MSFVVCVIGEIFQSLEMLLMGCGVGPGLHMLLFVCLGDGVGIGADADHSSMLSLSS